MRLRWIWLLFVLAGWAAPVLLMAQSKHAPTITEALSLKSISSPRVSPDGRYVAYQLQQADWKGNEYVRQLWLINVQTGAAIQLTRGKKSANGADWSPDGRWLAFITEREPAAVEPLSVTELAETKEGKKDEKKDEKKESDSSKPAAAQIWLISANGGEAWQLTKSETDISEFHWSKDSKSIAFSANAPESKAAKDRKERYSDYEVYEKDFRQNQLWSVDVSEAEKTALPVAAKRLLTDLALSVTEFSWSPDSTLIAFSATNNPLLAYSGDQDIYLLDLATNNAARKIVALEGPDSNPVFSPDGKRLCFQTSLAQPYYYYANGHIAAVELATVLKRPASTPGDVNDLTAKFDEDPYLIDWGPDGIYFAASQKTNAHLFRVSLDSPDIQRVSSPDEFLLDEISFTPDFKYIAYTASSPVLMDELYFSTVSPFHPRKLTDMTAQVHDWNLGTAEVISWKSQDGAVIEGILRKPANFDSSRRYPLLVKIHGGPTGISRPTLAPVTYAYPVQQFLAKGAVVLEPNYRGSAGYGGAFRALNVRNLGVGDMWDVMSGVDLLIAQGIADPAKLGAMGWSQGGYISSFLATHTDRFKAISEGAGISDWMTYYVNTDITPFTRQYLQATPWDDPEIYAKTSPITTIKQARTPTLIQQGSNDKRVPVPDSYELYRGLRDQGVESRMVLYTGFGHGVNKPKSQRALIQSNLDWFNHYIWNQPIPEDSPLNGSSELPEPK